VATTAAYQYYTHEEIEKIIFGKRFISFCSETFVFSSSIQKPKFKMNEIIARPILLFGCETWSLTLREDHRLRVFENRVLRRIFGPKRDEVTGGRRLLHRSNFVTCTSRKILSVTKARRISWVRHVTRKGETRIAYKILTGKTEGKRLFERPSRI
jgi:hypothetical protein